MYIDPELEQQRQRNPDEIVDVILVCDKYGGALQTKLERAGFHTTSSEQADIGLVYGRIRLANLSTLGRVEGVESVSPDSTQYAL